LPQMLWSDNGMTQCHTPEEQNLHIKCH